MAEGSARMLLRQQVLPGSHPSLAQGVALWPAEAPPAPAPRPWPKGRPRELSQHWHGWFCHRGASPASQPLTAYLVEDADDDGVQEPDARHTHQAEQEEVGLAVELEVGGLWVQDGAHQLPFRSAEAWIPKERIRREAWPESCQGGLEATGP